MRVTTIDVFGNWVSAAMARASREQWEAMQAASLAARSQARSQARLTARAAIDRLTSSPLYCRNAHDEMMKVYCLWLAKRTVRRFDRESREQAMRYYGELRSQAAFLALKASESKRADIQASLGNGEQWAQMETVIKFSGKQEVFPTVSAVKHEKLDVYIDPRHENRESLFRFNEVYTVSKARLFAPACGKVKPLVHTPKDKCLACRAERLAAKEARGLTEKEASIAHRCYADTGKKEKRPSGQATCEPLFCADLKKTTGYEKTLGFSRTIALRYLSKRMVFSPRSNAKASESEPESLKARKTSSSRAKVAFFNASEIEDIIQEAYCIFSGLTLGKKGQALVTLKTDDNPRNMLINTCNCCKRAYTLHLRAKHKERKRLDILAARLKSREDKARGYANRYYDEEIEKLQAAVSVHGYESQKLLAAVLGISESELSKRLSRLRARIAKQEASESRKARERIDDVYAARGIPVKASAQTLFLASR